ncbi:hypothetical protein HK101_004047 [Irineochytrium annulatum]|nr:hypothetical protein HK101_004047 [Irineochytrium annulatum]
MAANVVCMCPWGAAEALLKSGIVPSAGIVRALGKAVIWGAGDETIENLIEFCRARGLDTRGVWTGADVAGAALRGGPKVLRLALREMDEHKLALSKAIDRTIHVALKEGDLQNFRLLLNRHPDHFDRMDLPRWVSTVMFFFLPRDQSSRRANRRDDRLRILNILLNDVEEPAAIPHLSWKASHAAYQSAFVEGMDRLHELGLMDHAVITRARISEDADYDGFPAARGFARFLHLISAEVAENKYAIAFSDRIMADARKLAKGCEGKCTLAERDAFVAKAAEILRAAGAKRGLEAPA